MSTVENHLPPAAVGTATNAAGLSRPTGDTVQGAAPGLPVGAFAILGFALLAPIALYWRTAWGIGQIWHREETYAHGFFVVPFVLYMAWRAREALLAVQLRPNPWGLAGLALCGLGWLLADVASVNVGMQLMLVGMTWSLVLTLGGRALVKALLFPLGFLVFAVPFGQGLVPWLIDFTADFTVGMLRLTGIPVYREDTFFTIPSGQWSVVDACSGIRYLLASLMLGTVYAYLNYTKASKRALFIVLSGLVPILANGMRAYIIVMIGHLSGNELAHGVDHFIYGWVWFGVVVTLLFWLGSFWRDPEPARVPLNPKGGHRATGWSRLAGAAVASLGVLVVWPVWSAGAERLAGAHAEQWPQPQLPARAGDWSATGGTLTDWRPNYRNPTAHLAAVYQAGQTPVGVDVGYYSYSRQDAELINATHHLLHRQDRTWRRASHAFPDTGLSAPARVEEGLLVSRNQRLLAWRWYYVGGRHLQGDTQTKVLEATLRLAGGDTRAFGMVVYTPVEGDLPADVEAARARLEGFLSQALPALEQSLLAEAPAL